MQRLVRPSAAIRAARLSARVNPTAQRVVVQRVKVTRARNLFRTVLIGGGVTYFCWNIYSSAVLAPLFRHVEREYASLSPKERRALEKELEESDGSIFIAFPFTTTLIPAKPYKPTDPEWPRLMEVLQNGQLQHRIRRELAERVRETVARYADALGRNVGTPIGIKSSWLDINVPRQPPPTYQRSGILIDDMGIYWATEPVDAVTVFRLQSIMWPVAIAQSTWAFATAMARQHWAELRRLVGFPTSQPPPATPRSMVEALERSKFPASRRQIPDSGSAVEAPQGNAASKTADPRPSDAGASGGRTNFLKDAMSSHVDGMRGMSSGPFMEFRRVMTRTWRPVRPPPPRGSVYVQGFVEVETTRGFVVAEVRSHWNTKTREFEQDNTQIIIKKALVRLPPPPAT